MTANSSHDLGNILHRGDMNCFLRKWLEERNTPCDPVEGRRYRVQQILREMEKKSTPRATPGPEWEPSGKDGHTVVSRRDAGKRVPPRGK